jgi:hypothetical protein
VLTPCEDDTSSYDQGELKKFLFTDLESITPVGESAPFKLILGLPKVSVIPHFNFKKIK